MGLSRPRLILSVALAVVIALVCGAVASASPPSGTDASSTSTTTTAPISFPDNATVTVAVPALPTNFNPWSPAGSNAVTAMVMQQVWPQVSVLDNRLGTQVCTVLAANCPAALLVSAEPVSLHPLTIVYEIAKDARWSDRVPITGSDFSYLWRHVLAEAPQLPALDPVSGYEDIKSITSSGGGKTVTVVFDKPYADWPALFTNLVPAQVAGSAGFVTAFSGARVANLVSGGPYAITHVVPGREVVLARNPHYWGQRARIARIIFRVEPTEQDALSALEEGKVTIAQFPPSPAVDRIVASSTDLVEETSWSPVLWQLAFNLDAPIVSNPTVREAIAKAVDRHELVSDTIGLLTPTSSTVGNRLFGNGVNGGQGNDASYAAVDDADADQLLGSIGYHLDAAGIAINGLKQPLRLTLVGPTGSPLLASVEQELQAELLQAGIELVVHNVSEQALLGTVLPLGNYELALAPYDVTPYLSEDERLYTDPVTLPQDLAAETPSQRAAELGAAASAVTSGAVSGDVLGLADPTLPGLFAQAGSEFNPSSADDLYDQIDIALWQDMPTLPLFQMPVTTVTRDTVQGVSPSETWAGFMFDAEDWSYEKNAPPTVTTTTTATVSGP